MIHLEAPQCLIFVFCQKLNNDRINSRLLFFKSFMLFWRLEVYLKRRDYFQNPQWVSCHNLPLLIIIKSCVFTKKPQKLQNKTARNITNRIIHKQVRLDRGGRDWEMNSFAFKTIHIFSTQQHWAFMSHTKFEQYHNFIM